MLPHLFLASLGLVNQSNSVTPSAVQGLLASTFNSTADSLDIAVQANFDENRLFFSDLLDDLLIANEWNFRIQIEGNDTGMGTTSRHQLWFIDSYQAFRKLYLQVRGHTSGSVFFVLIVLRLQSYEDSIGLLNRIFLDLFQAMIVDVLVLIEPILGEVLVYTTFPFQENTCRSVNLVLLNRFVDGDFESLEFFRLKADNLHGCPLRVIARNSTRMFLDIQRFQMSPEGSGLEAEILNVVASKINFTPTISKSLPIDFEQKLTNLTTTGLYKLLEDGEADVIIGSQGHDLILDQLFSASRTHFQNIIVLTVRRLPHELPKLSWLLADMDMATWMCVWLTAFFTILVIGLSARVPKLSRLFRLKRNSADSRIFSVIEVFMGLSTVHLPKITFLRFCFIVWSLSALVIRAAYQGKIFDSYRRVINKEPPVTMPELINAQYTVYSRAAYAPFVEHLQGFGKIHFQNYSELRVQMRSAYKTAVVGSKAMVIADSSVEELEEIVMGELHAQFFCMFFQRHSFLTPRVNRIIADLDGAGFLQFWERRYKFHTSTKMKPHKTHIPEPVSLERFKYIVLYFALSLAFSFAVFLLEMSLYIFHTRHRTMCVRGE